MDTFAIKVWWKKILLHLKLFTFINESAKWQPWKLQDHLRHIIHDKYDKSNEYRICFQYDCEKLGDNYCVM